MLEANLVICVVVSILVRALGKHHMVLRWYRHQMCKPFMVAYIAAFDVAVLVITLRKCERSEHSRVEVVCCREQVVRKDGKSSTELWSSWELRKPRTYTVAWGGQNTNSWELRKNLLQATLL